MDEVTPSRDYQKAYRVRPRCGGGNLGESPSKETQEGPGGGPSCVSGAGRKLRFRPVWGSAASRLDACEQSSHAPREMGACLWSAVGGASASPTACVRLRLRPLR